MRRILVLLAMIWVRSVGAQTPAVPFTLQQVLSAPYASALVASPASGLFAWVENAEGVRNIWVAGKLRSGGNVPAQQLTHYTGDDAQEIRSLSWASDGQSLVYSRGAESGASGAPANPAHLQQQTPVEIWWLPTDRDPVPVKLGEGHSPVFEPLSSNVYFVRAGKIWVAPISKESVCGPDCVPIDHRPDVVTMGPVKQAVFDRGNASDLTFSSDGSTLAYVSHRRDHSFIGLFDLSALEGTLRFVAPSTGVDSAPAFSANGKQLAWMRWPFEDVAEFAANRVSNTPWSLMVADVATPDNARAVFTAEAGKMGSTIPHVATGEPKVWWLKDGRLVFPSEMDGWLHLYSVDTKAPGAKAVLLTPGNFEVASVAVDCCGQMLLYEANEHAIHMRGSPDPGPGLQAENERQSRRDEDKQHVFKMDMTNTDGYGGFPLSAAGIETSPVIARDGTIAALVSDEQTPMHAAVLSEMEPPKALHDTLPVGYPKDKLVAPEQVVFPSRLTATGTKKLELHGQLFLPAGEKNLSGLAKMDEKNVETMAAYVPLLQGKHAAILFLHGGPNRQMLLGYPGMEYYSNAYAMNQYLVSRGFIVLSVNYRCGIGYGMEFRQCEHAGADGGTEYEDVLAAVKYLRGRSDVDAKRIGIWGGSYGGYLTAMALARNSDLFAAGVDFHGVHDWNLEDNAADWKRGSNAEKDAIATRARASSPIADVAKWKSPVLLIHGDDDPDVAYKQTPMLAEALRARGVHVEEMVFPDEVHGFLLHQDWLKAYTAEAEFFERVLKPAEAVK